MKQPFYTDRLKVRNLENKAQRVIRHANKLLEVYFNVTGTQINDPAEILSLAVNPESQFKREALKLSKSKFPKSIVDLPGLDLSSLISIPDDFYQVKDIVSTFDFYSKLIPGFYTIQENKLVTSDEFKKYVIESCSFFAVTPDEQKRLDICNQLIQAYEKVESLLTQLPGCSIIADLKQHIPDKFISKFILLESEESTLRGAAMVSTKNRVWPNPAFVKDRKERPRLIPKPRKHVPELDLSRTNIFPTHIPQWNAQRPFNP